MRSHQYHHVVAATVSLALATWSPVEADSVTLNPAQDATLYEQAEGSLANGAGQYLFAGRTSTPRTRRALLSFDIAGAIPEGATITGVTLTLNMSKTVAVTHPHTLHRVQRAWGEGSVDDAADEGDGAAATAGSATWLHTFHDSTLWQTAGGDFDASASATTSVGALGVYTWSSAGLVVDVQAWLDEPAANFGWLLRGDETGGRTAKRFDSRQHPTPSRRPALAIEFEPPAGANSDPAVAATVPPQRAYVGERIVLVLTDIFVDADGDTLLFAADATADSIVSTQVSGDSLVVTGLATGSTSVSLTASDAVSTAATSVDVSIVSIAGDFNFSGAVDFDDFFAFADHFGRSSADAAWDSHFDLSPNNAVDFDDFFVFADNFGLTRQTASPENGGDL